MKLRIVLDAPIKSESRNWIKDELMGGPQLQYAIFYIFVNFRIHRFGTIADIEQMYR